MSVIEQAPLDYAQPVAFDFAHLRRTLKSNGLQADDSEPSRLDVLLADDLVLRFLNSDNGDEIVGFVGTPWHFHPPFGFVVGDNRLIELDLDDLVVAISAGDLLVVEMYELGRPVDRWLTHRDEQMSFKYAKPEEEIRVRVVTPRVSSL